MQMQGINHITLSVANLERSIAFYQNALVAKLLVTGRKLAYFELCGIWLALNVQEDIPRTEIHASYTHIAFSVEAQQLPAWEKRLAEHGTTIEPSRPRDPRDGESIYFRDPDGHLLELHTGTLAERMAYYREQMAHMQFE